MRIMRSAPAARVPCPAGIALSSGASSGPCASPVRATRSGMYSSAPLRPVAARTAPAMPGRSCPLARSGGGSGEVAGAGAAHHRLSGGLQRQVTLRIRSPPTGAHPPAAPGSGSSAATKALAACSSRLAGSTPASQARAASSGKLVHGVLLPNVQLLLIEARGGAPQVRGIKATRHLIKAEQSVHRAGVPETEQVVGQGCGQVTTFAVLAHACRAMALGQGRAVTADDERDVPIGRCRQAQSRQDQQLPRCVGEVILAAQRLGDPHAGIVHGIREEERGRAIRAPHDKVADVIAQEALWPVDKVGELDALARGTRKRQLAGRPCPWRRARSAGVSALQVPA